MKGINEICRNIDKCNSLEQLEVIRIELLKNKKKYPLIQIEFIAEYFNDKCNEI